MKIILIPRGPAPSLNATIHWLDTLRLRRTTARAPRARLQNNEGPRPSSILPWCFKFSENFRVYCNNSHSITRQFAFFPQCVFVLIAGLSQRGARFGFGGHARRPSDHEDPDSRETSRAGSSRGPPGSGARARAA